MLVPSLFNYRFVDDMFNDMLPSEIFKPFASFDSSGLMKTDVKEFDDRYEAKIDLPGYSKEDVSAALKDGYMTITAKREEKHDEKDEDGKYIRRERSCGHCSRSFYVGDAVTEEDIKAKFSDGILTVDVPKKDPRPAIEDKKTIMIEG